MNKSMNRIKNTDTHKNNTPPREKKADVDSGTLRNSVPSMTAEIMKDLEVNMMRVKNATDMNKMHSDSQYSGNL